MHLADLQTLNNTELNEFYKFAGAYIILSTEQPSKSVLLTSLPLPQDPNSQVLLSDLFFGEAKYSPQMR